jgi:hypothetical protein
MQSITTTADLNDAIAQLEKQHAEEEAVMRDKLHDTYDSIQPVNLIKTTYRQLAGSKEMKEAIIDTTIGIAAGYVSKAIFDGTSKSPARRAAGTILQLAVTQAVRNHPEEIKTFGRMVFNMFRSRPRR